MLWRIICFAGYGYAAFATSRIALGRMLQADQSTLSKILTFSENRVYGGCGTAFNRKLSTCRLEVCSYKLVCLGTSMQYIRVSAVLYSPHPTPIFMIGITDHSTYMKIFHFALQIIHI